MLNRSFRLWWTCSCVQVSLSVRILESIKSYSPRHRPAIIIAGICRGNRNKEMSQRRVWHSMGVFIRAEETVPHTTSRETNLNVKFCHRKLLHLWNSSIFILNFHRMCTEHVWFDIRAGFTYCNISMVTHRDDRADMFPSPVQSYRATEISLKVIDSGWCVCQRVCVCVCLWECEGVCVHVCASERVIAWEREWQPCSACCLVRQDPTVYLSEVTALCQKYVNNLILTINFKVKGLLQKLPTFKAKTEIKGKLTEREWQTDCEN